MNDFVELWKSQQAAVKNIVYAGNHKTKTTPYVEIEWKNRLETTLEPLDEYTLRKDLCKYMLCRFFAFVCVLWPFLYMRPKTLRLGQRSMKKMS